MARIVALCSLCLIVACGGEDDVIPSCDDQFLADSTVQQFVQQLEQAIEARDCASSQNIYTVFKLTSQPYEACPSSVSKLAELDSAYQALQESCDSDTILNSMQATLSGAIAGSFEAESPVAGQPLVIATLDSTNFSILATDVVSLTISNQIAFNLVNFQGSGVYPISLVAGNTAVFSQFIIDISNPTEPNITPYGGLSGSLEITETDSAFFGTFNFSAVNQNFQSVNVSDGKFVISK